MFDEDDASRPLRRLPGLYRRWEVAELLKARHDYRIEDAGETIDGTPLLAVYTDDGVEGVS
jgi:hypothetical protein